MAQREGIKFAFVTPGIAWVLVFTIFPFLPKKGSPTSPGSPREHTDVLLYGW